MGDLAQAWIGHGLTSFDAFVRRFGVGPTHVVHAPGRVNLIGGHIDYHGLPVLPIAIDRGIDILFRARSDPAVNAVSDQPGYPETSFELSPSIPAAEDGHWSNYLRGPAQSLARNDGALLGLDALITSTLPASVGLSSSSALAVGMGLALAEANRIPVVREQFADQMADAERYTGTRGGGMDQATSLLGLEGHALHLHFKPLRAEPVAVPDGVQVIIAHSMETAEKSGVRRADYNDRRIQGELALRSVAGAFGLPADTSYGDLLEVDDLVARSARLLTTPRREYFRHVVTESDRVTRAVAALRSGDLAGLGKLMRASHESLRSDYGVSTASLDELVSIAMEAGAFGARMTGAGFGGAVVILAPAHLTSAIETAVIDDFFRPGGVPHPGDAGLLFRVGAAGGALVQEADSRKQT